MTISTQRLRLLRGNSAAASAFTGLQGELIFDTTLYTLRLQDGVTPGGYTLATSAQLANVAANINYGNSNVGAYLTTYTGNLTAGNILSNNYLYANGVSILTGIQSNYGNANVAAYLVANPQPGTYSNTNVASYLPTYTGNIAANIVKNNQTWEFVANGNLRYPDGTLYSGSNITIPTGTGNVFRWKFNDPSIGSETITLDWNLLGTKTFGQWYLATNDTAKYWLLDSDTKQLSFSNAGAVDGGGKLTFGTATKGGTGNINDIELTSTVSNVYVRANSNSWRFGNDGKTVIPGTIEESTRTSQLILSENTFRLESNVRAGSAYIEGQESALFLLGGENGTLIGAGSSSWQFLANSDLRLPTNTANIIYFNGENILYNIQGNSVTANVGTFNTLYGTLGTAAQPSITSLGTLSGLAISGTTSTGALQVNGNATIGNLLVTGTSTIVGNINMISGNSGQFFGNSPTGFNALYTGIAAGYTPLQQTIIQSSGNYNDYVQNNLENVNSGNAATGDYVVTADNGTDATYYIDMGIASSNFDGLSPNIVGNSVRANDAYLYTLGNGAGNQGGNLIIGAGTASKVVKIIAGGGHDHDVVATAAAGAFTVNGSVTGTYFIGNGALLTGIAASSNYSNANVASYLPTYGGNISVGNLTLASNSSNIVFTNGATIYGDTSSRNGSIVLQPAASGTFPSVIVGGAGRLAAPNGSVHQIFNTNDLTFQVQLKGAAIAATSTTSGSFTTTGGIGISGNIYAGGAVVATGNVTGNFFIGNGALLTGIVASGSTYSNTNVAAYLPIYGGPVNANVITGTANATVNGLAVNSTATIGSTLGVTGNITTTGNVTVTANVVAGNLITSGSGGNISGVNIVYGNVVGSGNSTVQDFTVNGNATIGGNLTISGVYAGYAPARPAMRVYGNTSSQFTANTTISNQSIDFNQGNYYNNSTGLFTAPVAGLFHCYATVRVGNNNALNQAALLKNGTLSGANVISFWETDTNTGTASHFSMTGYAKCVVGDTISLKVIAGNVQFDSNDSWGITYIG